MSVDFGGWLRGGGSIVAAQAPLRAQIQEARTEDKQTDVSLRRGNAILDPQTVRIEMDNTASESISDAGRGATQKLTIFGIHGHPDLDDTDIRRGDRFVMDSAEYTVTSVNRQMHGQVQARAEAVGG